MDTYKEQKINMVINLKTSTRGVYKQYLQILNGLLGFTNKELEVLSFLILFDEENKDSKLLTPNNRRRFAQELGMSIHNFNNYVKTLKDKKALDDNKVSPRLKPEIVDGKVHIGFNMQVDG